MSGEPIRLDWRSVAANLAAGIRAAQAGNSGLAATMLASYDLAEQFHQRMGAPEPGPPRPPVAGLAHVYFAVYDEFGSPARDVLAAQAPPGPVFIRSIGYQAGMDHVTPGDDRIVIYYEIPGGRPA